VDSQITSECPRVHRLLVQIKGDLFVYVDRTEPVTRKALRRAFQIDRVGMCGRCSEQRCDDDGCFQLQSYLVANWRFGSSVEPPIELDRSALSGSKLGYGVQTQFFGSKSQAFL
jgi:hypothetical protein